MRTMSSNPPTNLVTQAAAITHMTPLFRSSEDASIATYTKLPAVENGNDLVDLPVNADVDDAMHRASFFDDEDGEDIDSCLDLCSPRALLNVGGLLLMTVGVLVVFIGLPILAFIQRAAQ